MYSERDFVDQGKERRQEEGKKTLLSTMESWWASRHSLPVVNGTQVSPLSALFTAL